MAGKRVANNRAVKFTVKKRIQGERSRWGMTLAGLLALISFSGTMAALLGYGVATSLETKFAAPAEEIFSSPFELIQLSVYAIGPFFENLPNMSLWEIYTDAWLDWAPFMLVYAIIVLIAAVLFARRPQLRRWWDESRAIAKARQHATFRVETGRQFAAKGLFAILIFSLLPPLVPIVLLFAFLLLVIFVILVPLLGGTAGAAHIQKYVIEPKLCAPLITSEQRLKLAGRKVGGGKQIFAKCVEVQSLERKSIARGRVVFSTSGTMVLFDDKTGVLTRIPIHETLVVLIDHL